MTFSTRGLLFSVPNLFVRRISGLLPKAIRSRMFLLVGLMLLPLLLLVASTYKQVYQIRHSQALMTEMEVAQGVATTFSTFVDSVRRDELAVARAITILRPENINSIRQLLVEAVEDYPALRSLNWVAPTGQVLASSMEHIAGRSLAHRQYFKNIVAGSEWEIGDLTEQGAFVAAPTVVIASAVRDRNGKLTGMVVAGIEPSRFGQIVLTQKRPEEGSISVFDSKGTLVYHNMFPFIEWKDRIGWKTHDVLLLRAMASKTPQSGIVSYPAPSMRWVSARVPVGNTGWTAGAGRKMEIAFDPVRRQMFQDLFFMAGVSLFSFLLAYLMGLTIVEPLRRLEHDSRELGKGLEVTCCDPDAPTEVLSLRSTVVGMARELTGSSRALRRARDELEIRVQERTQELAKTFQDLHHETEQRLIAVDELRFKERMLIQQSRLAAMGEMLSNISHQWRQPLNCLGLIIQNLSLAYKRGALTGKELEGGVEKAMQVISHMSQTIDDFLDFFSSDKRKEVFSINEVVDKMLALFEGELNQMQVNVETEGKTPCTINGYRNEYSQVLLNILTNARDAFKERQIARPKITVTIRCQENTSVVLITDNAGGIANTIIDRIFDPYFTTKEPDKGTGIGLFMSKIIIEKNMHGRLAVRNVQDGAEFRIEVSK